MTPYRKNIICRFCKKTVIAKSSNALTCSSCRKKLYERSHLKLATATVGVIAELEVCTDLLKRKYEVFRAVSSSCSCDIAILKDNKLKRIEVRTGYRGFRDQIFTRRKHKADILAIYIHNENKVIYEPSL